MLLTLFLLHAYIFVKHPYPDQKLRAGFSAQQVQKIIPEAVVEEDGILMLDMDVLQKYMREAKRELRAKNS